MNSKVLPIIAGLVAAAVGPFIWIGCHLFLGQGSVWIPMVGVGALIGLVMRLVSQSGDRALPVVAVVLTVLSAVVGNIWWDSYLFTPFMLQESIKRMVGNLLFVVLTAVGCYLAFIISRRTGFTPNAERREASDSRDVQ